MAKRTGTPPVWFRVGEELLPHLQQRARDDSSPALSAAAKTALERYIAIMEDERRRLDLSEAEWHLIADATNGTIWEPYSIPLLWAEIDDAIKLDGLDKKWAVDGPALVAKLRGLDLAGKVAIIDAVERFWRAAPNARIADIVGKQG